MKKTMLIAALALILNAGLSAQDAPVRTRVEKQNRSAATIQTQTQGQYQNYGQMTSEQKQERNAEKKALKNQKKELQRQQKKLNKQQATGSQEKQMSRSRTAVKNKGARTATPLKNAAKVSGSTGPGKK